MEAARPATADDIVRILELTRALRAELADQRGGDLWWRTHEPVEHHEPGLRALLDYDDDCLLVGTLDDQVIGYAITRRHRLPDGAHLAVIGELFVEPGAREVAVGESLVGQVLAWAEARGCLGVDATALPGNRAAKNFFETHGFTARSLTMHRSLGVAPTDQA
jgi:GNAT superfamily N-acetyltransferase